MSKITEVTKNYYRVGTSGLCSVIIDNELMKKVVKVEQEFDKKMKCLLNDNLEHVETEDWSLCYPNKIQTSFLAINTDVNHDKKTRVNYIHKTEVTKIKFLFDIDGLSIYDDEVTNYLSDYLSERIKPEEENK